MPDDLPTAAPARRTATRTVPPAGASSPWYMKLAAAADGVRARHRGLLRVGTLALCLLAVAALFRGAGDGPRAATVTAAVAAAALLVLLPLTFPWLIIDVGRFSPRRVAAIAGVGFTEALRRRVWLVAPLAAIAVVVVTQFARPLDEQDAVRQTAKNCLFATGFVVVVTSVLLACTNLPKEVESRVIFTIVTKPITRLEVVLGKIAGFSLVNALLLLAMGLFTVAYVEGKAWVLGGQIRTALDAGVVDEAERARLARYASEGLTVAKAIDWPGDLQVYGREPNWSEPDATRARWIAGGQTTYFVAPFKVTEADVAAFQPAITAYLESLAAYDALQRAAQQAAERAELERASRAGTKPTTAPAANLPPPPPSPFYLTLTLRVAEHAPTPDERDAAEGQPRAGGAKDKDGPLVPRFSLTALNPKSGKPVAATDIKGTEVPLTLNEDGAPGPAGTRVFRLPISREGLVELLLSGRGANDDVGRFIVEVSSPTPTLEFGVVPGVTPVSIDLIPDPKAAKPTYRIGVADAESIDAGTSGIGGRHDPPGIRFYSRLSRYGMHVTGRAPEYGGGPGGPGVVAVYSFRDVPAPRATNGKVTLQTKVSIDRAGDLDANQHRSSSVVLQVHNRKNAAVASAPVEFSPSTNRVVDIQVDAAALEGGDFDVVVRGLTPGQALGVSGLLASVPSVGVVSAQHPFALNLLKALGVLWLLTVLVVTVAVFCSTFLSWPIAVVLTVVLLLGRWGVDELGESLLPGATRTTVGEVFRMRDPAKNRALTESLEALNAALRTTAKVLPDLGEFTAVEDLNRGVSMPAARLGRALRELLTYGVPLVLVTYLVL
ncbi:MAG TPA: ABC transporter permease, partial [Humisphaera sp.]